MAESLPDKDNILTFCSQTRLFSMTLSLTVTPWDTNIAIVPDTLSSIAQVGKQPYPLNDCFGVTMTVPLLEKQVIVQLLTTP